MSIVRIQAGIKAFVHSNTASIICCALCLNYYLNGRHLRHYPRRIPSLPSYACSPQAWRCFRTYFASSRRLQMYCNLPFEPLVCRDSGTLCVCIYIYMYIKILQYIKSHTGSKVAVNCSQMRETKLFATKASAAVPVPTSAKAWRLQLGARVETVLIWSKSANLCELNALWPPSSFCSRSK